MKTNNTLIALLAMIIPVMMNGQSTANRAFQPDASYLLGYAHYTEQQKQQFSQAEDPSELLIHADDLSKQAAKLNREAFSLPANEKERALHNAEELQHQSDIFLLAACELTAYNNRTEFSILKRAFVNSLNGLDQENGTVKQSKTYFFIAVQTFRNARELREEAYAQLSVAATLANLRIAEEKEIKAFAKLTEAATLLENGSPQMLAAK